MSQQHPISDFTQAALESLRSLVDVNTVIGAPVTAPDGTIVIPVSKVSFGYGAGGTDLPTERPENFGGCTGGGVTITPLAFLILRSGGVELLQMQTAENTADRIVNSVPGVLDKIIAAFPKKDKDKEQEAE